MVPRNPQEKSYCPKRFYGTNDFSSIFQDIFKLFFSVHYTHSCPYFLVRKQIVTPCRTDGTFKKEYF